MTEYAGTERRPKATVLLVDDEEYVAEGLRRLFHSSYEVAVASSAAQALSILRRRPIDAVISDERMPGMSGSELMAIVAAEFPHTARIILTGQATVEAAVRSINEGKVSRFLEKPCSPCELRAAVSEALRSAAIAGAADRLLALARAENERIPPAGPKPEISAGSSDEACSRAHESGFTREQLSTLSLREREVFELLVDGLRVAQIAKALFVSPHTVRNHLKALFGKLDVHSQTELVTKSRGR